MTLGETIRLLRTEQTLTQPELAEKARIEQSYLSKLENDKATPSFDIISRIAQALGLTGMQLIHKLSHSYINEHLSHLPEVAAEYASVMELRERRTRRKLLLAATLLLAGTALYLAGAKEFFLTERTWFYSSEGVFKSGQPYWQFQDSPSSGEAGREFFERQQANKGRIEKAFFQSHQYLGSEFIQDVPGGQRYFIMYDSNDTPRPLNVMLEILGIVMGIAGGLAAGYTIWRHHTR